MKKPAPLHIIDNRQVFLCGLNPPLPKTLCASAIPTKSDLDSLDVELLFNTEPLAPPEPEAVPKRAKPNVPSETVSLFFRERNIAVTPEKEALIKLFIDWSKDKSFTHL